MFITMHALRLLIKVKLTVHKKRVTNTVYKTFVIKFLNSNLLGNNVNDLTIS